jgi:hypothetical protein
MAKIRLDVDQLSVESFNVLPEAQPNPGTVKAHENDVAFDSFNNPSCVGSCVTCPGGQTCTCPATCAPTCNRSCPPCVLVISVDVPCRVSIDVACAVSFDVPCFGTVVDDAGF